MIYQDNGLAFLSRDTVKWDGVKPEVKQVSAWVEQFTEKITGADRYVTSAKRTVAEQQAAQDHLLTHFGQDYYNHVYQHQGQDVATMPHVEGRAIDRQYVDDLHVLRIYSLINAEYKATLAPLLGYEPSSLLVVEGGNCIHCQIPRDLSKIPLYLQLVKNVINHILITTDNTPLA